MKCYCCSGLLFSECCQKFLKGMAQVSTPKELMRSRYSAYATSSIEYLQKTTAPNSPHQASYKELEEFAQSVEWLKLEIISFSDLEVEFKAYYKDYNRVKVLHERSSFVEIDGSWYYSDGDIFPSAIGRNEKCPCGRGKKYKKCCMES